MVSEHESSVGIGVQTSSSSVGMTSGVSDSMGLAQWPVLKTI